MFRESFGVKILLVTPLDPEQHGNSVEHARATFLAHQGHEVTCLYRAMNRGAGTTRFLRDNLGYSSQERMEDGVHWVRLDPFFNTYAGLRRSARAAEATGPGRRFGLGLLAGLAPLGILRELSFTACAMAWGRRRGRPYYDRGLGFGAWGGAVVEHLRRRGRIGESVYVDRDHEPGQVTGRLRRWWTARIERRALEQATHVVTVGARLSALREQQLGRRPLLTPNGIDLERFGRVAGSPAPAEPAVVVYAGNVETWSGLDLVLDALARLGKRDLHPELRVIGPGLPGHVAALRERSERLGLSERVEFLGPQPPPSIPDHLGKAHIGLCLSPQDLFRTYACPLKLAEYYGAGLAVLASSGTEAGDRVQAEGTGLAVPHDLDGVTRGLESLLSEPTLRERFGEAGRACARGLDWKDLLEQEERRLAGCAVDGGSV